MFLFLFVILLNINSYALFHSLITTCFIYNTNSLWNLHFEYPLINTRKSLYFAQSLWRAQHALLDRHKISNSCAHTAWKWLKLIEIGLGISDRHEISNSRAHIAWKWLKLIEIGLGIFEILYTKTPQNSLKFHTQKHVYLLYINFHPAFSDLFSIHSYQNRVLNSREYKVWNGPTMVEIRLVFHQIF